MLLEPSTMPFLEMEEMEVRQALYDTERKCGREHPNTVSRIIAFASIVFYQGRISRGIPGLERGLCNSERA
jgi:hypothetical protein